MYNSEVCGASADADAGARAGSNRVRIDGDALSSNDLSRPSSAALEAEVRSAADMAAGESEVRSDESESSALTRRANANRFGD